LARFDAIVLGAGIVGVSCALHLQKRGLKVALVDRGGPGEETSYGNTGVIEGNTVFPPVFPHSISALVRVALKQATEANYHLSFLPRVAPWLLAYRAESTPGRLAAFARAMRPLYARSVAEHEALLNDANAMRYLRKNGWIKVYRDPGGFASLDRELDTARELGLFFRALDSDGARALEPSLSPVFRRAVYWPEAASFSDPLAVTRAYAARFKAQGGELRSGDARSLRRAGTSWQIDAGEGPVEAEAAVIALGPWAPDVLKPLGIRLPLAVKRGYHLHFRPTGNAAISRPIVDLDLGYAFSPMEQGVRLTTGAEFAARDATPTPVQLDRLMPKARTLFPFGEPIEPKPWMGSRPCFPDSRPVIGRAPGQPGLWLAFGHAHWGLTLGPVTGRLIAEMVTAATPFCDPTPYRAERFA
jgi:D-amino-acid dehydrogenase